MKYVATLFGIGFSPIAPGTVASAVTIPIVWLLHWAGGFGLLFIATCLVTLLGYYASAAYTAQLGADADPGEVVIDEVAGQMIALWPMSLGMVMAGSAPHIFPYPGWIAAFVLFRIFDILKPWPVSWADRKHGPLGIMLDDLIAGFLAAIGGVALAILAHKVFL